MPDSVVVDTNILFSALLRKRSRFAEVLLSSEHVFYVNELVLTELFKHRNRIVQGSALREEEVIALLYRLLRVVHVFKEDLVSQEHRAQAYALCEGIDETDTPHLAIVLALDGLLWTGDKTLKAGLEAKGFTRFFEP